MCAARAVLLLGLRTSGGARTCVSFTLHSSRRVSSRARSKVATFIRTSLRVKWSNNRSEGLNGEWQRRTKWKASFVDTMCSTVCGAPQLEGSYILCKREASNTNDLYMLWRLYAWGHEYTCVRVHIVYVRTRRLYIIGENLNLAVLRSIAKSSN